MADFEENRDSEDENKGQELLPPIERIVTPHDVTSIADDDEVIYVVGTRGQKVTQIRGLEQMKKLRELVLRSCLIRDMQGVETLPSTLNKLELYDNAIEALRGLTPLTNLRILDMSYNTVRDMSPVSACPLLEELYLAQNKVSVISGLENMKHLRVLDLGANRIRAMDGLAGLESLKSLWLGKNKITEITNVSHMKSLKQLDVQNNRLISLGDELMSLCGLEELYLACNGLESVAGLPSSDQAPKLSTIDLSRNKITSLVGIETLTLLEELWISSNLIPDDIASIAPLTQLPKLTCLYLEHCPIAKDKDPMEYRNSILQVLPSLTQLDADLVRR